MIYLNSKSLVGYINKEKPDVIISTQFFVNEIVALVKKQGVINPKFFCVITDFRLHSIWISKAVDIYIAGSLKTKKDLISRGIAAENVKVLGIPVDSKFLDSPNRNDLSQRLGIDAGKFTALIMTGAVGIGPIEKIVDCLKDEVQLLVVCGKNKNLEDRLRKKKLGMVKVFGFIDNTHELMSVSDIIITKPGGLSIAESLVKNLPIIFISAIPGQESRNARFIVDNGIGVMPADLNSLVRTMRQWKSSPEVLTQIKDKIKKLSHPYTAREILKVL